jgi:8-oxo-dGTP pyrophosphatase MutT (NUDIX family)
VSVIPIPAASLIVTRDLGDGPEILLLKRSARSRFMPEAYVFPGGAIDAADSSDRTSRICRLDDAEASRKLGLRSGGLTYFVAAVRETFEESGLLLAYDSTGQIVDFRAWEGASFEQGLAEACERYHWCLAVDRLRYFAHWITPSEFSRRFDTRFFIAPASAHQNTAISSDEMTEFVWRTPTQALADNAAGRLRILEPTATMVAELACFASLDTLFDWVEQERVITAR